MTDFVSFHLNLLDTEETFKDIHNKWNSTSLDYVEFVVQILDSLITDLLKKYKRLFKGKENKCLETFKESLIQRSSTCSPSLSSASMIKMKSI